MTTRTFTGRSFADALAKVKKELGNDAVILKSEKRSSTSSFGLSGKELFEVTAVLGEEVKADLENGTDFANELSVQLKDEHNGRNSASQNYEMALLRSEVSALRDQLGEIIKHFRYNNLPSLPESLARSLSQMTEAGLERELATDLANEALVQLGPEALTSAEEISTFVITKVSQIAPPAVNRVVPRHNRPYKIALVGAPGAGKTSTLQKLATDPEGYGKLKIGLVTLDTHRMAAVEQLRTFARVSGLPLEVAYQPKDISVALNKLTASQIILIDTAGCSPGEDQRMSDLTALLNAVEPDETHLVLNSTSRVQEQVSVARRFQELGVTHISLTRLDENSQPGSLVTISQMARKPIAWLTNGQKFVGQIERYRPEWLRSQMFGARYAPSAFVPLKSTASLA